MKFQPLLLTILLTCCLNSCSNYVKNVHGQIDKNSNSSRNSQRGKDRFAMYRNKNEPASPNNLSNRSDKYSHLSTSDRRNNLPNVQRQYRQNQRPRTSARDFEDDENTGSLWKPQGQENYLFSQNKQKRSGDIVVIKVLDKLKNDISGELKRSFPAKPVAKAKSDKKPGKEGDAPADKTPASPEPKAAAPETETAINETGPNGEKVFDKISSVVIEEINDEYVLLRGKKEVLYRKSKRAVEVQALVARKDILPDDSVLSDRILETNIMALR